MKQCSLVNALTTQHALFVPFFWGLVQEFNLFIYHFIYIYIYMELFTLALKNTLSIISNVRVKIKSICSPK